MSPANNTFSSLVKALCRTDALCDVKHFRKAGGNDANVCSAGWCRDNTGTGEGTFLHHYRTVCWHTIWKAQGAKEVKHGPFWGFRKAPDPGSNPQCSDVRWPLDHCVAWAIILLLQNKKWQWPHFISKKGTSSFSKNKKTGHVLTSRRVQL